MLSSSGHRIIDVPEFGDEGTTTSLLQQQQQQPQPYHRSHHHHHDPARRTSRSRRLITRRRVSTVMVMRHCGGSRWRNGHARFSHDPDHGIIDIDNDNDNDDANNSQAQQGQQQQQQQQQQQPDHAAVLQSSATLGSSNNNTNSNNSNSYSCRSGGWRRAGGGQTSRSQVTMITLLVLAASAMHATRLVLPHLQQSRSLVNSSTSHKNKIESPLITNTTVTATATATATADTTTTTTNHNNHRSSMSWMLSMTPLSSSSIQPQSMIRMMDQLWKVLDLKHNDSFSWMKKTTMIMMMRLLPVHDKHKKKEEQQIKTISSLPLALNNLRKTGNALPLSSLVLSLSSQQQQHRRWDDTSMVQQALPSQHREDPVMSDQSQHMSTPPQHPPPLRHSSLVRQPTLPVVPPRQQQQHQSQPSFSTKVAATTTITTSVKQGINAKKQNLHQSRTMIMGRKKATIQQEMTIHNKAPPDTNRQTSDISTQEEQGEGEASRSEGEKEMDQSSNNNRTYNISSSDNNNNNDWYGYRSWEELHQRRTRFPSIHDRVKFYMSNWYVPPCPSNPASHIQYRWIAAATKASGTTTTRQQQEQQQQQSLDNVNNKNSTLSRGNGDELWMLELPDPVTGKQRTFRLLGDVEMNRVLYVDQEITARCKLSYCDTTTRTILPAFDRVRIQMSNSNNKKKWKRQANATVQSERSIPPIVQYGDAESTMAYEPALRDRSLYPNFPVMKKFRWVLQPGELNRITTAVKTCRPPTAPLLAPPATKSHFQYGPRNVPEDRTQFQPIIVKQKAERHFGMLNQIANADIPWSEKKNMAIFRGSVTGVHTAGHSITNEMLRTWTSTDLCHYVERCRLVYEHDHSTLVDARLVRGADDYVIPDLVNDVSVYGARMDYQQMLEYKALIVLQGHDVATGLKWALLSNSVVLMPPPTKTSWAMEELLQPWVHYIPLNADLSNVDEQMQWIINHDVEANQIAQQGKLWIQDLVFHPDAEADDGTIMEEIIRRYQLHFVPAAFADDWNIENEEEEEEEERTTPMANGR